jgi:hypothetical protein
MKGRPRRPPRRPAWPCAHVLGYGQDADSDGDWADDKDSDMRQG